MSHVIFFVAEWLGIQLGHAWIGITEKGTELTGPLCDLTKARIEL